MKSISIKIKQSYLGLMTLVLISIVLSSFLLSGCILGFFAVGASAGGLIVSDQRDMSTRSEDRYIQHRLDVNIVQDPQFKESHIEPSSFDRVVLLVGETPVASLKVTAEKIAQSTPNVTKVYNEITIREPVSFSQKSKDTWITSEVKSVLLVKPGLRSGSVKVITEDSVVYLMGLVTKTQADLAVDAARRVSGVKSVVKVFEYLQ
jgi:osmotically-inducible protein OsmY